MYSISERDLVAWSKIPLTIGLQELEEHYQKMVLLQKRSLLCFAFVTAAMHGQQHSRGMTYR
jgi:uncharacterized membrane protein YcfT